MKTMKSAFCLLLSLLMLCALACGSVSAYAADAYTPVDGTTTTFTKYLAVKTDANIPAATFSFSVEAGTAVDANIEDGTLAVLAGLEPEKIEIGDASFTAGQTATLGTAEDGIVNSTDLQYASTTVTVDLTKVKFPEPGVYRYIITEAESAAPFVNDPVATRTLDVYVQDDEGALAIQGYVLYSGTITNGPKADGTDEGKDPKFVNQAETANLTFSKTVTGNQGARDKFFQFTLVIESAGPGTIVNVIASRTAPTQTASTIYEASVMTGENIGNNVTTLTAGEDGKIEHNFYLSHGDSVQVTGIPKTATYALTEVKEDYTNTPPNNARGNFQNGDAAVEFTNSREGVVPTGLALSLVPGAVVILMAASALVLLNRKKSRA